MSRTLEPLLADVMASVGEADPIACSRQLCDAILNHAWALEREMFCPTASDEEIYAKAKAGVVDGIRIMLQTRGPDDGN